MVNAVEKVLTFRAYLILIDGCKCQKTNHPELSVILNGRHVLFYIYRSNLKKKKSSCVELFLLIVLKMNSVHVASKLHLGLPEVVKYMFNIV